MTEPKWQEETIKLIHGAGGEESQQLLEGLIFPRLANPTLDRREDAGIFEMADHLFALTTDSHVVKPIFFPGGDVGKLSVCGTINDLVVVGSKPLALTLGLIIEDGFSSQDLRRILDSIHEQAKACEVAVIAGDTKVVEAGAVDRIFINTTGYGQVLPQATLGKERIADGDVVILSGSLARHGVSVLVARHELAPDVPVQSDVAALDSLLLPLLQEFSGQIKFLRDPTRGGLATTLNELVQGAAWGIEIEENSLPLDDNVAALIDLLGLDPLAVANEGIAVCICESQAAEKICHQLTQHPLGQRAAVVGRVSQKRPAKVVLNTSSGGSRLIGYPDLEQLPRIC